MYNKVLEQFPTIVSSLLEYSKDSIEYLSLQIEVDNANEVTEVHKFSLNRLNVEVRRTNDRRKHMVRNKNNVCTYLSM